MSPPHPFTPSPQQGAIGRISAKQHRRVCLVQTEDAVLAEELLARKKLAQDVVGRLTDRVLLIRPGRAEAVLAELQKMGHTPQVAGAGARTGRGGEGPLRSQGGGKGPGPAAS